MLSSIWVQQILGVDLSKHYSPVVNDIIFCILLLMVIHFKFLAKFVNYGTAFLYGDMDEEFSMECPHGISDVGRDDCFVLNKCIYGLVQATRQNYKKAVEILKKSGFVGGNVNPCLYKELKGYSFHSIVCRQ